MRKLLCLLAVTLFFIPLVFAGEWIALNNSDEPFTVQTISSDGDRTVIKYTVNGYYMEDVFIDGKSYTLFNKMRKESMIEEKGYPRLPRVNRSIIIPDDGMMDWEVISSNYIEISDIDIAPSKGHLLRSVDPSTVPYTFSDAYQRDAFFPGELVNLREPYILRDIRGLVVELNSFQYNPVTRTFRIYRDVTIEVKKVAAGGANTIVRSEPLTKMDHQFYKIYRRHFINYDELDYITLLESGELLIICYNNFIDLLEPLAEWKNQKGIPTTLVPLSQVGVNTTEIKNYIRDFYIANDLAYVLLIGDHQQLPTFSSGSDPVYGLLAGGDDYFDIFVGRFSAENRSQTETQVERTIDYEKYPQAGADWYHMGLGVASSQGPGHHGEIDKVHITLIANKLLRYTYTQVDSAYDPWGTANMVFNSLNDGRSIINYCGHGSTTSWGSTGFNNGNVNDLVNSNMLPHIVSVACVNGNFVSTTCFAEAWLRATHSTTGEPTGAVGAYMSKISQSWNPPMDMQDEGVDLMVADSMRTYGGICFNGSMLMIDLNGSTGVNEAKNWTIFGDPSLYLRSDTPVDLTVNYTPVLFLGLSTFDVTVIGPGGPVEEAMVCGTNEELYAFGLTDANGEITLDFINPPTQPGTFTLTVTGWNTMPYIVEVDIIPPSGPYVIYESHTIDDDIFGNNNGQLDYSEEAQIGLTLENVGVAQATNVSAIISSSDPLITIHEDSAFFGDIPSDSTATIDHAYRVELSPEVEDGHVLNFLVNATDGINVWESNFVVIAHAPDVVFSNLTVDDAAGGNGNGNLDPGETADLLVTLTNDGSSDMAGMTADLSTLDPYITINIGSWTVYGIIPPGGEVEGLFNVTVAPDCPQEHTIDFAIDVSDGSGYTGLVGFSTVVGNILYLPTGPDNHGYMAYDRFDVPELPVFDWVEICPDSGGPGTLVPFVIDDQVLHYELPFTFQYYGVEYDSFTISSNGWLGMGIVTETDYSNSGIPDSDGPSPMIASYWEDLSPQRTNSGGVWYWYDETNHLYIVEFNHVEQFAPTGNFETFQTIFYDPAHYPTITGDGRMKMQYKEMSAASQNEGTMGIENQSETDGIEYFFDEDYDIHAAPIINGCAVIYTTPSSAPELVITLTPATTPIVIPATGGEFDFDLTIENTGAGAAYFDGWIEAELPNSTIYGPIILRQNINLGPMGSLMRSMTQTIPGGAPSGNYSYIANVGNHPDVVFNSDNFPFEKLPGDGSGSQYGDWKLTGWDEQAGAAVAVVPDDYFLSQNYPNPFNPETTISFGLPHSGEVSLKVFNILGETAAILVEGRMSAGYYQFKWNAAGLSSGIYFYRLEAEGYHEVKKMMLVR